MAWNALSEFWKLALQYWPQDWDGDQLSPLDQDRDRDNSGLEPLTSPHLSPEGHLSFAVWGPRTDSEVGLLVRESGAELQPLKDFPVLWGLQAAYSAVSLRVNSCRNASIWQQRELHQPPWEPGWKMREMNLWKAKRIINGVNSMKLLKKGKYNEPQQNASN